MTEKSKNEHVGRVDGNYTSKNTAARPAAEKEKSDASYDYHPWESIRDRMLGILRK
jgi:hypothetical protein